MMYTRKGRYPKLQSRTHALRGTVKVFLLSCQRTLPGGASVTSHVGSARGDRSTHPTRGGPASRARGCASMGTPGPVRPPDGLALGHVAAGRSPAPSRQAGSIPPPPPRRGGGGTSDTAGARAPKTACRGVRGRRPSRPIFAGQPRWESVLGVGHRRRGESNADHHYRRAGGRMSAHCALISYTRCQKRCEHGREHD
jgi:hypothetical protein